MSLLPLESSFITLDELALSHDLDLQALNKIAAIYPFRLTRHYFNLIQKKGDPIWLQAVPAADELLHDSQPADPLNETGLSPVPGLIHRYPDRVVWLVSGSCAVYCRFCMRKRGVGCSGAIATDIPASLAYIRENRAIRDVILSGGDPLMLGDEQLEEILSALRSIPHVEIIRIGTRVPVTLPERITERLCSLLSRYHPLYVNTHFNHPDEICDASTAACAMLADAGVQLGNQTVLLKGVNNDPVVMAQLFRKLLQVRVKPYYLHQMDLVKGTSHFRTSVSQGLEIMAALRGNVSGMAVPYYVIDLPEGKGKVPLLPGHEINPDGTLTLATYRGEKVVYMDL
jgi:lysine 2,3-aminomutase